MLWLLICRRRSRQGDLEVRFSPQVLIKCLEQEGGDQSRSAIPSLFQLRRMFGEIPPAQISAAGLFIKYSCNAARPASRPRILFCRLCVFCLCSACLHLGDSRGEPEELSVTQHSSHFLSVTAAFREAPVGLHSVISPQPHHHHRHDLPHIQ